MLKLSIVWVALPDSGGGGIPPCDTDGGPTLIDLMFWEGPGGGGGPMGGTLGGVVCGYGLAGGLGQAGGYGLLLLSCCLGG